MKRADELARAELREIATCPHGGDVELRIEAEKSEDEEILDFSSNVNPLGPSPRALNAIESSLWSIAFYPDTNSTRLKEAVAQHFGNITPGNVVVGNGSCELIYLFASVFASKGDEVLIPVPTFGEYAKAAAIAGARIIPIPLNDAFAVTSSQVTGALTPSTKIIFLCNPNNPTSRLIEKKNLLEIVEFALQRDVLVLIDEDFMDFVTPRKRFTFVDEVERYSNIFILRSFTKAHALAGLRVGFGIGAEDAIELLEKVKPPWNVNSLAQVAAIEAVRDRQHQEETNATIESERRYLYRELRTIDGITVHPADANFFLINLGKSRLKAPQLKQAMLRRRILIRDASSFTGLSEDYIRIAIRKRRDNLRFLEVFKQLLESRS